MKSLITFLFLFFGTGLFAQGHLIQHSQSALIVGSSLNSQNYLTTLSGFVGYSFHGNLDVGLSFKRGSMAQFGGYYGVKETSFSPFVNLYLVRQESSYSPVSVSIGGEYNAFAMRGDLGQATPMIGDNKVIELDMRVFTQVNVAPNVGFHPFLEGSYGRSEMSFHSIADGMLNSDQLTQRYYKACLGLPMSFLVGHTDKVVFTPSVAYSNLGTEFNMSIGVVLASQYNARKCKKGWCPVF